MKKIITLFILLFCFVLHAQAPQGFNYQATVRNSSGALIINQNVYFKFNIIQGSPTSLPAFSETHYVPTDDLGQVNLVIGQGSATIGSFTTIDWAVGNYYLGIELNTGSGYTAMGTTQLLSVPYALYAQNSGNSTASTPNLSQVLAINNSANNLQIKNLQNPTNIQDAATKNYVDTQITANALPNGTSVGDLLSWNGSSWQPIANNSAFGGKSTLFLGGDITDAEAVTSISNQIGPNTERIVIRGTTQLTNVTINGLQNLMSIEIDGNIALQNVTINGLVSSGDINVVNNQNLQNIIIETQKVNGGITFYYNNSNYSVSFPTLLQVASNESLGRSINIDNSNSISFPLLTTVNQRIDLSYFHGSGISFPSLLNTNGISAFGDNITNVNISALNTCNGLTLKGSLASSQINSILNKMLTVNPSSGKNIYLDQQNPPAPPTGQGLIDKQTLINNGNNVITD